MGRVILLAATLCGVMAGTTGPALAAREGEEAAAREDFRHGMKAFEDKRYPEALDAFTRGYELSKRPRFLLNMAHAYRKMGELREALSTYKRFLLTEPKPEDREVAQQAVSQIEAYMREDQALHAPPAEVRIGPALPAFSAPPGSTAAPGLSLTDQAAPPPRPLYRRWYVWVGAGALVAAGVATAVVLSSGGGGNSYKTSGTLGAVRL